MRYPLLALVVWALPGLSGSVLAQRIILIPEHGAGDKVVVICNLPPEVRPAVREALQCEPQVAFLYWRCYLFRDGFDFWTSNGRFVLYHDGQYWEFPRETLEKMLGQGAESVLSTPWNYWVPPGLATSLALVAVLCVCVYRSAQSRANRLVKDSRYQLALHVYVQGLPGDSEPTGEDKKKAFAAGVEFLQKSGVPAEKAEPALRLLVGELERGRSYELREQAVEHEQAGEWEQAIDYYEQAARLREEWDRKDHEFLLKCIKRVRDKQARSGSA
jgi:hypothetical protein